MSQQDKISPEYYVLLRRSQEILATIKLKRESGTVDLRELHELDNEVSQLADQMTGMLAFLPIPEV